MFESCFATPADTYRASSPATVTTPTIRDERHRHETSMYANLANIIYGMRYIWKARKNLTQYQSIIKYPSGISKFPWHACFSTLNCLFNVSTQARVKHRNSPPMSRKILAQKQSILLIDRWQISFRSPFFKFILLVNFSTFNCLLASSWHAPKLTTHSKPNR